MSFTPRTISQVYQDYITEKASFPSLSGLTSTAVDLTTLLAKINSGSQVEIWNLDAYIQSVAIATLESNMAIFEIDVENIKSTAPIPSLQWFVETAKLFQKGDTLTIDPTNWRPYYTSIDTSKQIILSSAGEEKGGYIYLKIRGDASKGSSDILSAPDLAAFESYLNKYKTAGSQVVVINENPDLILFSGMTILYDPQYDLTTLTNSVTAAITNYLSNIEFNSLFYMNVLVNGLQAVPGVIDVEWTQLGQKRSISGSYESTYTYFMWQIKSYAGYFEQDPSNSITYTPLT